MVLVEYSNSNSRIGFSSIDMPPAFTSVLCELNTTTNENDTRSIQFHNTYVSGCRSDSQCDLESQLNIVNVSKYTVITRRQIWDQAMQNPEGRVVWLNT
jgi:hypothetical protein